MSMPCVNLQLMFIMNNSSCIMYKYYVFDLSDIEVDVLSLKIVGRPSVCGIMIS